MSQPSVALPMRVGGVEVLVQAVDARQTGAEETSTIEKVTEPYEKAGGAMPVSDWI